MTELVADKLDVPPESIDPDESLVAQGLDSIGAVEISIHLERALGVEIEATEPMAFDSLAAVVAAVQAKLDVGADPGRAADATQVARGREGPATLAQSRLFRLDERLAHPETYHVHLPTRVEVEIDVPALDAALAHVVAAHSSLRARFALKGDEVRIEVAAEARVPIEVHDLRGPRDADRRLDVLSREQATRPFDLGAGPLFRVSLAHLDGAATAMIFTWHHIIVDGLSVGVLMKALSRAYDAVCAGRRLPALAAPCFLSFAEDERRWLVSAEAAASRRWWKAELDGLQPLGLPWDDRTRSAAQPGGRHVFGLDPALAAGVHRLARASACTPFVVLLAAWSVLIQRYASVDDLVVGTVASRRDRAALERMVGFLANLLPVRCELAEDPTVVVYLSRLRERVAGALAHRRLPHDQIASGQISPLIRVAFILEDGRWFKEPFAGLAASPLSDSVSGDVDGTAKFDLALVLCGGAEGYQGAIEYSAALVGPEEVTALAAQLVAVLSAMVAGPECSLSELSLGAPMAATQPANRDVGGDAWHPSIDRFAQQAEATPDRVALRCDGVSTTYGALLQRVEGTAQALRDAGVAPELRVGLCLPRSADLVAAYLAIWRAGGAVVPLDPALPARRLEHMLADAEVRVVVGALPPGVDASVDIVLPTDAGASPTRTAATEPSHLAYVIYTSGSTGAPKGVLVEHRGVPNLLDAYVSTFALTESDRWLAWASVGFDASIPELLTPLMVGATTVIATDAQVADPASLLALIASEAVSVAVLTPSLLRRLEPDVALRVLMSAGEVCDAGVVERWSGATSKLLNGYGPTEATVWSSVAVCNVGEVPSIGVPLQGVLHYVLDAAGRPLPDGVPGELYIGGVGVARGYTGPRALTEARFWADPFSGEAGARMFRTGDRVQRTADGGLEFLGRLDDQIKLRGFRIEPGEIEALLVLQPQVSEACVAAVGPKGDQRLVAFVVAEAAAIDPAMLLLALAERLPRYMVPVTCALMDALPLTASGKVDRAALVLPAAARSADDAPGPPTTATERSLVKLWGRLLGRRDIGVTDDFFELGGNSLMTLDLLAEVERTFGEQIPQSTFVLAPTIASLASALDGDGEVEAAPTLVTVQAGGGGAPLVCVLSGYGDLVAFRALARRLGPEQTVLACQPSGQVGGPIEGLAEIYARAIAGACTQGSLRICGYSVGGLVGLEVARQLRAAGRDVDFVGLLDAPTEIDGTDILTVRAAGKIGGIADRLGVGGRSRFRRVLRYISQDRAFQEHVSRLEDHAPQPYAGKLTLFVPEYSPKRARWGRRGWEAIAAGGLDVHVVPGDHESFIRGVNMVELARLLRSCLAALPA